MSDQVWSDEWPNRIIERANALGCTGVLEFVGLFPLESYVEVAKRLGNDVAALQLMDLLTKEARERNQEKSLAMDSLLRFFHYHNKRGWNVGKHAKFRQAGVYSDWINMSRLGDPEKPNQIEKEAVWEELKKINPPEGWLPQSIDDTILKAAFQKAW